MVGKFMRGEIDFAEGTFSYQSAQCVVSDMSEVF